MDERDREVFEGLLSSLGWLGPVPESGFDALALGRLQVRGYPDPEAKLAEFKAAMLGGRATRSQVAGAPHLTLGSD